MRIPEKARRRFIGKDEVGGSNPPISSKPRKPVISRLAGFSFA